MCRTDLLFWINTFCWLYEPRPRPRTIPFITWPHQDPALIKAERCLGHRDCGLEKSRSEGASWMMLMLFLKYWLFGDPHDETMKNFSFGLVSKDHDSVDLKDDPDCLMWKLDFQLKHLPFWMVPKFDRGLTNHILRNTENGSTIAGYSATGNVASGGRKVAFLMDEMSKFPRNFDYAAMTSTQYVTECRYVVSTFNGNSGYYYDAMRGQASSMEKIILDWKDNPTRNLGMFEVKRGRIRQLDADSNPVPESYVTESAGIFEILRNRGFPIEGRLRSPWYDGQCMRTAATPASIAEELDRDPERSGSPFFDLHVLDRLIEESIEPLARGYLDFDRQSYDPERFTESKEGEWSIWFPPLAGGGPPEDVSYIIGADISSGGGGSMGSNSCLSVCNTRGEKVAEFVSPRVYPQGLAHIAYAAGHWFKGMNRVALLIFEANGPCGAQFSREIQDIGYQNLFMDEREMEISRTKTKKVGFSNQGEKRSSLYGQYRQALQMGRFSNPSALSLEECKFYHISNKPGGIEHSSIGSRDDPSGAGLNHGDRATADALSYRGLIDIVGTDTHPRRASDIGLIEHKEPSIFDTEAPTGSFLWRKIEDNQRRKAIADTW